MKRPSLQFYPGDWRKDPTVICLSLAAKGLWLEMLLLMHESPQRGYLNLTPQQIARAVGSTPSEVKTKLSELKAAGTVSVAADGSLYNRRMVREEEISGKRSEVGKIGAESRWQTNGKRDGKVEILPHPIEGEGEGEVEIELQETLEILKELYISAGLPLAPKHEMLCCQFIMDVPANKRNRIPRYVQHMLDSGRWSSAAKTKGLLNLLRDGDWDVPIIERTAKFHTNGTRKRTLAEELAE